MYLDCVAHKEFGVRRQSEAATALSIATRFLFNSTQSGVALTLATARHI